MKEFNDGKNYEIVKKHNDTDDVKELARDDLICVGKILAVEFYEQPGSGR